MKNLMIEFYTLSFKTLEVLDLPKFSWPPPRASAKEIIPITSLIKPPHTLDHIDSQITKALQNIGHTEYSYFTTPQNGYALVTKLEKINNDGTPKSGIERWEAKLDSTASFNLKYIFKVLFTANAGYYRIIVFIVSPIPIIEDTIPVSEEAAVNWIRQGSDRLPAHLSELTFDDRYRCTALIYEFEQEKAGSLPNLISSNIPAHMHLEASGFYKALN
ncbi:MAG: hypothetical protein PHU14_15735 [Methylovulum sp.]|nr:hypothetical protein [Methylovulum sp.]